MRTLIIDNYDSFTYNLYHYIAELSAVEPLVIRNDEASWSPVMLEEFDNVVLSPGPGHPANVHDFGICRDIVNIGQLPVLGVCLGHQGICHVLGGEVGLAPEPRHGRRSTVYHDRSDLFAGIPSPLQVVRYHSLAVTTVPPSFTVTARSDDGVVMGVRHRDRPLWGVQFHPESIQTEFGRHLLLNFRNLTARWQATQQRPPRSARPRVPTPPTRSNASSATRSTASSATRSTASSAAQHPPVRSGSQDGGPWRILVERVPVRVDPEHLFTTLFAGHDHAFWLDSSQNDGDLGQISVMGDATGPLARVARADVTTGTVTVTDHGEVSTVTSPFLDWLDADLRQHRATPATPLPFDFALGWVGYLGYELKAECGAGSVHRSPTPDATMVFADRAVVVDHREDTVHLLALAQDPQTRQARDWLDSMAVQVRAAPGRVSPGIVPVPTAPGIPRLELRHPRSRYTRLIEACQEAIRVGESYEICLTNMLTVHDVPDPWPLYRTWRRHSPAPFAAYLQFGDVSVLSASPERFLRVHPDGTVESRPIKGTRPRGTAPCEDDALRLDLLGSEKDRAENLMIVDLVRNDLGRVGQISTVRVPLMFDVESYATVHQLVSTVTATLRPGLSAVDCFREAFPGGSMTGAPKLRTMEIIDTVETGPRGVYSGALGYFSLNGAADLGMVIRTLVVTGRRAHYGIGGAITALSDPEAEFEETAVKARGLMRVLGTEFPESAPSTVAARAAEAADLH